MSNVSNLSDTAANAEATALGTLMNAGTIQVFSGTQPANANTALAGNTLLATLTLASPAFGSPSGGAITANAITSGVAGNSGTATFARVYETDRTTVVMDVVVGTSGAGLNLSTTTIVAGATVAISA